jgi:EAL domain-containing protein (putative c-di-GMP-specific phosphodiesterase class I)
VSASLRSEHLSVVFQPIVALANGSVFAQEVLLRCSGATCAGPEELFSRAVETGSAGRLGRMIREVATSLCDDVPLFLNIHPAELEERWLIRPDDPIYTHGVDIYLEITESVPLHHFALCQSVLREVRWRGNVHLVVDDLGAGYSNLKRIADLEPRMVKLDRELIRGLDSSQRQRELVRCIVTLCTDMGADVVAEGIETPGELAAARDAGAGYGQGYLLARPAYPAPEVAWPGAGAGVAPSAASRSRPHSEAFPAGERRRTG